MNCLRTKQSAKERTDFILPTCLFAPCFPTKTSVVLHTCYMPSQSHSSRFRQLNIFDEQYGSLSSSLCSFLHSPLTSSLWAPNILFSTTFSNILNLRSSFSVSYQVSHPHKTNGKIMVLYILIFYFLIANWKTNEKLRALLRCLYITRTQFGKHLVY